MNLMLAFDNNRDRKTILVVSSRDPRARYSFITKPLAIMHKYNVIEFISDSNYLRFVLRSLHFAMRRPKIDYMILIGGEVTGFFWCILARLFLNAKIILRLGGDPIAAKRQRIKGALINIQLFALIKLSVCHISTLILMKYVDAIIVVASHLQMEIKGYFNKKKPFYVVPQPVKKLEDFKLPICKSPRILLTVTNLNYPDKLDGVCTMLKYIHNNKNRFDHGFEYHILGGGSFLPELKKRASAYGDLNYIKIHGFVPNPKPFFKEADIFLYCSELDGLPNSLLEAQSFCLPILINYHSIFTELVKEGEHVLFFEKNNERDFADKLNKLLIDDELRSRLAINNYQNIIDNYSEVAVARKLDICLQNLNAV
jgi:glycosyltransferase involved in cell wall biosynthesis